MGVVDKRVWKNRSSRRALRRRVLTDKKKKKKKIIKRKKSLTEYRKVLAQRTRKEKVGRVVSIIHTPSPTCRLTSRLMTVEFEPSRRFVHHLNINNRSRIPIERPMTRQSTRIDDWAQIFLKLGPRPKVKKKKKINPIRFRHECALLSKRIKKKNYKIRELSK